MQETGIKTRSPADAAPSENKTKPQTKQKLKIIEIKGSKPHKDISNPGDQAHSGKFLYLNQAMATAYVFLTSSTHKLILLHVDKV